MKFKTIRDYDLHDKHVLLRADLNVPAQKGKVTDTTRIDRLKPTIDYLRDAGAKVLILSHFGRPDGERNMQMSLAFLVSALQESWGGTVKFAQDCIGEKVQAVANSLKPGDVALLENLRFYKGEEANEPGFVRALAGPGEIYVNDAFSAAHRAHASTEGLAHLLPSAAGLLMEEELRALDAALENPKKPVLAITGGSKISTKLAVLKNLVTKVDYLVLGGAMATTFLHAQGAEIGNSLCEKDMAEEARAIMEHAKKNNCEIILPVDCVTVTELQPGAESQVVPANAIPAGRMAIDVGPESIKAIVEKIKSCKTVVWNGPLGVFEIKPFDNGTNEVAKAVAALTQSGTIVSIAGGGDTIAALENAESADRFTYISTAGGAFLEWLEGKALPGVAALSCSR